MPCYDKKLEAVRYTSQLFSHFFKSDFRSEFETTDSNGTKIRDVDCVLATVELEKLIEGIGILFFFFQKPFKKSINPL